MQIAQRIPYLKAAWLAVAAVLLAAVVSLVAATPAQAEDVPVSGTWGDNLTWSIDENWAFTITGEGAMKEDELDYYPWDFYKEGITSITIGDEVTSVAGGALDGCEKVTSLTVPGSVDVIGPGAFRGCTSLESVEILGHVACISDHAFEDCWKLKSVVLPPAVDTIGDSAFWGCAIRSIELPEFLESIGDAAFYNCGKLESIVIPDYVTSIGTSAFEKCTSLVSVTLPKEDVSFGDAVFSDCRSLAAIELPVDMTSIPEAMFYCTGLTSIVIPDFVETIEYMAFRECADLTSVFVPDSVTLIGKAAFIFCSSLEILRLPAGPFTIGDGAFWGCDNLKTVIFGAELEAVGDSAFKDCDSLSSVWYGGTEDDRQGIDIDEANNGALLGATWHYGSTQPSLENATVSLSTSTYIYAAKQRTPSVTVAMEGVTLKKGRDFTVSYSSGRTAVGSYTVTVNGIGVFSGMNSASFTIKPLDISSARAKATMTLSTTNYSYDGKAKKPAVTVKATVGDTASKTLMGGKTVDGVAIKLTYSSGRTAIGTYKVTAKGTGNYTGTLTKTFKVNPKKAYVKRLTPGHGTLAWTATTKPATKYGSKYQVQYRRYGTSTWKYASSSASYTGKIGITTKLTKGKKYYVRLRAVKTVNGTTYYGAWSDKKLSAAIK